MDWASSLREPLEIAEQLAGAVADLQDRLRVTKAHYLPTRYPKSLLMDLQSIRFPACKAWKLSAIPVRLVTQFVLHWA
jgi:hypothetical protein